MIVALLSPCKADVILRPKSAKTIFSAYFFEFLQNFIYLSFYEKSDVVISLACQLSLVTNVTAKIINKNFQLNLQYILTDTKIKKMIHLTLLHCVVLILVP